MLLRLAQMETISENTSLDLSFNSIFTSQDSNTFAPQSSCRVRAAWTAGVMIYSGMGDREYTGKDLMFNKTSETSKMTWGPV